MPIFAHSERNCFRTRPAEVWTFERKWNLTVSVFETSACRLVSTVLILTLNKAVDGGINHTHRITEFRKNRVKVVTFRYISVMCGR